MIWPLDKIVIMWEQYSPKGIKVLTEDIHVKVDAIHEALNDESSAQVLLKLAVAKDKELSEVKQRMETHKNLTMSVIDHIEDMLWAKDLRGRYILANKVFRAKFCYGMAWDKLEYATDAELSREAKRNVGELNHTFCDMCANSDQLVLETGQSAEFLETGMIDGKEIKLIVSKSPIYNFKGIMFGTCGTGRDVTQWYNDLERVIQNGHDCTGEGKKLLMRELNKLAFEG